MRAGRLRHRVEIHAPTKVRTTEGGFTETWTRSGDAWASIDPLHGKEFFENQAVEGQTTHKIRIRGEHAVDSTYRIVYGSRTFHILSVLDINERGITKELMVKETQ